VAQDLVAQDLVGGAPFGALDVHFGLDDRHQPVAEDLLRDMGCQVVSAANGDEAHHLLDTKPVDLVFSDVVMPGISGVELARKIREVKADVPVLLATGYSDEIVRSGAEFAVMPKPYRPQELADAIVTLLKRHRERAA
jgi:CheY-like chemotaxis protein